MGWRNMGRWFIYKEMNKKIFNLIDNNFAHDKYSVAGVDSKHIAWDRELKDLNNPTFYSHIRMLDIQKGLSSKDKSYGFIVESRGIEALGYQLVEPVIPYFDKVFTHNSDFIKKYENCKWIPGGGIWIGGRNDLPHGEGEIQIYNKNKLCSMVSSNKKMCELHLVRLQIIDFLKNNTKIDKFTGGGGPGDGNWLPIFRTLKDYMFSIVIENYIDDLYFTEKILNCFATGTIPIYLGARNIGSVFDKNGILQFSSFEEFNNILNNLSEDEYHSRMEAVKYNFEKCLQFRSIEDYIYEKYFITR
jgi:hypothetical protein